MVLAAFRQVLAYTIEIISGGQRNGSFERFSVHKTRVLAVFSKLWRFVAVFLAEPVFVAVTGVPAAHKAIEI